MTPNDTIVIRDSQFQFPALKSDVLKAGKDRMEVINMDGDAYADWCSQIIPHGSTYHHLSVGTDECIDLCETLVGSGADVWYVD